MKQFIEQPSEELRKRKEGGKKVKNTLRKKEERADEGCKEKNFF